MRKRILSAFLAVLGILTFGSAHAQSGQRLRTVGVSWHTTLDPSAYSSAAVAYTRGDSNTVYRGTGLRNSAQQVDTTQSIDIRGFALPGPYVTAAVSDTVSWLRFSLYPLGTSPAVAADSITVALQVSDDNTNWTATTYSGFLSSVGTTPSSSISLEAGSSNSFFYVIRQQLGALGPFNPSTTATAISIKWCYGFKYIRLIITGDHTGQYDAEVTGFIASENPINTR